MRQLKNSKTLYFISFEFALFCRKGLSTLKKYLTQHKNKYHVILSAICIINNSFTIFNAIKYILVFNHYQRTE